MSIVDATKKLLGMRKRSMSNTEILAELKAGGLVLTSAEPLNVVGSVLTRRFNQVGDVVRVGRGVWGLKEWYPGRSFKVVKNGAEAERAEQEPEADVPLAAETEEEANQRILDELMDRRSEGKAPF
jgi:DNA-directed RNA polymerase delta subunit